MSADLMDRLAAEIVEFCAGARVAAVLPRPQSGLSLLFADRTRPNLDLSCGPPSGWMGVCHGRLEAGQGPSPRLLAGVARRLDDALLMAVRLLDGDRILRLDFEAGWSLVVELLGVHGNIYLLDPAGKVEVRFRSISRPGGMLTEGQTWRPPGTTPAGREGTLWRAPRGPLPTHPGLLSAVPLQEMDPLAPLSPGDLTVCPDGPGGSSLCFMPCRTLGEAVARRAARLHLHQEARSYRQALERRLRRAAKRLARLLGNLQQEASAAARHGVIRHWAEALLADLRRARRRGDQVEVRDPYGAAGESLLLTVPARVDLRHQADVWFKEARRMERAESRIHARCEEMKGRSCQLETLLDRLRKVTHVRDLEDILAALPSWVKPQQDRLRQDGEASPPGKRASLRQRRMERDPRARQVRRFRLAGGLHLLVGGNGPVNDFLTFRMARGQDFWLHAADHPGAHAILRNPSRQAYPPAAVLRQAASLAAYYSKAPRNAPVEVRWTQVKHLRKAKGSPPGTVLLPRFSTLLVRPSRPSRTGLPEDP